MIGIERPSERHVSFKDLVDCSVRDGWIGPRSVAAVAFIP